MAWAWVQDDSAYNSGSGTSQACAFSSSVTAGSLIVVAASTKTITATATCSDSLNGAHTLAVGPTVNASLGGGGFSCWIFYFYNSAGGACTVTVQFSATIDHTRVNILEYSGIRTASDPLDDVAAATGASGTGNSGDADAAENLELVFGHGLHDAGDIAEGAGFTARTKATAYDQTEDKNAATTGAYAATFGGSSANWIAQVALFKPPGAAGLVIPVAMAGYRRRWA